MRKTRPLLVLILTTLALACAPAQRVPLIRDGFVLTSETYRVSAPTDWRTLTSLGKDTLEFSQMVVDAQFVRCPQTEMMLIGRASYREKAAVNGEAGDKIFLEMANSLVDEVYGARKNARPRSNNNAEIVLVAGNRAAQITYETNIEGGSFCDTANPIGAVKERYLLVDSGGRGLGLSNHAGIWAQKFVVFQFESPIDKFDTNVPEFERVANSLEFSGR